MTAKELEKLLKEMTLEINQYKRKELDHRNLFEQVLVAHVAISELRNVYRKKWSEI